MIWAHVRLALPVSAQSPSIAKMPDLPQPSILRDWSAVAHSFDALLSSTVQTSGEARK